MNDHHIFYSPVAIRTSVYDLNNGLVSYWKVKGALLIKLCGVKWADKMLSEVLSHSLYMYKYALFDGFVTLQKSGLHINKHSYVLEISDSLYVIKTTFSHGIYLS